MDEATDGLQKKVEEIKTLYGQKHYDEALSSIKEGESEFGDKQEIITLKREIETEIDKIIKETQSYNRDGNFKAALKNIDDLLLMNPKSFKSLNKEKKIAEKGIKLQLNKAKKSYKAGDMAEALALLEELVQISGSEVIEGNLDNIQEMLTALKSEKLPEQEQPMVEEQAKVEEPVERPPIKKKNIDKKFQEALNKIGEKEYEEARLLLSDITVSDPEHKEAKNLLNILELDAKKIPNLFWQNRFDDALLAISIHLSKNPNDQEIQSYKWRIQSQVAQKVEEIKKALSEDEYNYAMSEIRDALKKNPVAFKELEVLRKKAIAMAEGRSPDEIEEEIKIEEPEKEKTSKPIIPIIIGAAGLVVAALILYFLFFGGEKEIVPLPGRLLLTKIENIDISNLSATVDESPLDLENLQATELQAGAHNLKFQKGARIYTKEITLTEDTTMEFRIPLFPLTVNISPSGEIWEEEKQIRESGSSHTLSLLPGEYTFSIRQEGYREQTRDIVISDEDPPSPVDISLIPIPPQEPGTLNVQLMPSGRVYEGSRLLATFPPLQQNISLSPGTHTLRFTTNEEGCEERVLSFRITSGASRSTTIYLCFGFLNINTIPPGARISIDGSTVDIEGNSYGTTPKANIRLPKGLHTLTVEHPGHPSKSIQVIIQTNETVNQSVDLTKGP
ncbi:MAG: PEGA domain-containing protein [Candidatus Aminicenantes bacterium]|nr:PEGA domain-containing protein [Candidatus Aminicenantes bacterium]